jgi:hypothetical protein
MATERILDAEDQREYSECSKCYQLIEIAQFLLCNWQ